MKIYLFYHAVISDWNHGNAHFLRGIITSLQSRGRIFEAAGAGACMITDYWEGIDDFFTPGKEILVARDGNEVAEILRKLDKTKAAQIGQAAKAKVLKAHSYLIRAQLVDQIFMHRNVLSRV